MGLFRYPTSTSGYFNIGVALLGTGHKHIAWLLLSVDRGASIRFVKPLKVRAGI